MSALDGVELRFRNFYYCNSCDVEWDDIWDSMCDDECPECGICYTPVSSEDYEEE